MSADEARKLTGLRKTTDVTLKRGYTASAERLPVTELKKLPGKKKPPTLTLKRGKNQSL